MLRLTLALIGGLTACTVLAADFQPVDSIKAAALGALPVGSEAEATLDPALRLPRCDASLVARVQGSNSVEVSCPDGWRLFVPVRVRRSQTVLVLSRGIAPGETITADAFIPETRDASRIVGAAVADPAQVLGRVARRMLSAGAVLSSTDLVAQRLVHRGDSVALVSRRGGVEVRVAGKALADAGENERVTVENLSSRRVVQGVVGPGGDVWVNR
ncbi:flagellar basal body P-ring formation chaperone FlgA [Pseudoxanthomonas sp. SE1]|uniref:flagellar basal body P-ring formation chaperone FlgA n=1 Tax=Pseudoxanthomonas sp. SE1 TaxID=1664560 RepID=UPI00240E574B|nr:flagellar basal body P-ring formation chaperone FlgA [Pseudoxanthomonas sp. SE1]WFC43932.1 flagellar basal body P-ring formation chaperone FlgA [Pseudoxanthomonas sp. SE1]